MINMFNQTFALITKTIDNANSNACEIFESWLTHDNITFIVAIIGATLSIWNFVKDLWESRSSIRVHCKGYKVGKVDKYEIAYFELFFENQSKLPISISRMFLKYQTRIIEFEWLPALILKIDRRRGNTITDTERRYSEKIPHTIDGLGAWGGYFYFKTELPFDETDFAKSKKRLIIRTNRGDKRLKNVIQ